ncbi:winged helix-turn-helix domain-containing protein [Cryobacterium sp. SO2]|uniref:winged helix-turn-helix domain-containing protein n=1 Tax=Cryobacterium sp. SO2 TaxID=1897060 RepID=UPI00223D4E70|nr:winged helix-turn-helix domain-containing protein [Cryobacterium sp. SO2]WEO78481.1 winged helix-turn-helix domain-containing protein [Cryobacterium sp. SO2]
MDWAGGEADVGDGRDGDQARGFSFSVQLDGAGALPGRPAALSPEAVAAAMTELVTRLVPDAEVDLVVEPATPAVAILIDVSRQLLVVDDRPVQLSYREFRLLCYLVLRPGISVSREELIDAQRRWSRVTSPRTIDVHIQRLRVKLGAYGDILRTERGMGYRYDAHADVRIRR